MASSDRVKSGQNPGTTTLYVNCVSEGTPGSASFTGDFDMTNPTGIGYFGTGYHAEIDDVRIYNRALGAAEASAIHLAGRAGAYPPASGLVAHWKLNETSGTNVDDVQNNYEATWVNGADVNDIPGQIGGAFQFVADANDRQVNAGNITQLNSAGASTIAAWIRDDNHALRSRLICKSVDLNNDIKISSWDDGKLYLEVGNGGNSVAQWNAYTSTIPQGIWYHAAFVFDGGGAAHADKAKIYVNGIQRTLAFTGADIPETTANLAAANFSFGDQFCENGTGTAAAMDDVRVYSKALSATEVADLYSYSELYFSSAAALQVCDGSNWISFSSAGN